MLVNKLEVLEQLPNEKLIKKAEQAIVKKDAVILSEAKQAQADYLLTLDIKHFKTKKAKKFVMPTQIVTPKELLQ